jgi:hypothetical protein
MPHHDELTTQVHHEESTTTSPPLLHQDRRPFNFQPTTCLWPQHILLRNVFKLPARPSAPEPHNGQDSLKEVGKEGSAEHAALPEASLPSSAASVSTSTPPQPLQLTAVYAAPGQVDLNMTTCPLPRMQEPAESGFFLLFTCPPPPSHVRASRRWYFNSVHMSATSLGGPRKPGVNLLCHLSTLNVVYNNFMYISVIFHASVSHSARVQQILSMVQT